MTSRKKNNFFVINIPSNVPGSFSYVDPLHKVRTVDYVADQQGFHPVLSDAPPEHPTDSESVARAKDRHYQLYAKIAEEHANPHPECKYWM